MKSIIMLICCLFLTGCNGGPSICDTRGDQESYLCEIAESMGARLEDTGNILMVANLVAIDSGKYTREDAQQVFMTLHGMLEKSPSYGFIRAEILKRFNKYPGLFIVAGVYMDQMDKPQIISNFDRNLLLSWTEKQIALLGN